MVSRKTTMSFIFFIHKRYCSFEYSYPTSIFCVLRRALFFLFTYKVISNTLMLTLNEVLHTAQDDVHVIIFIIVVGNVNTVLG